MISYTALVPHGSYVVHFASLHLAEIRYLLFFDAMLSTGKINFGQARDSITGKLELLCFATILWDLFRMIIKGTLDFFVKKLGKKLLNEIKTAINDSVKGCLEKALQLDSSYILGEIKAEKVVTL